MALDTSFDFDSDELVDVLDEVPFWSAPFGQALLEEIRFRPGMVALDLGCGTGFPLTELAMRLGRSARVLGLDPWHAALRRAARKSRQFGLANLTLILGVAEALPLTTGSVDLVTSNNALNNVDDLDAALRECFRVLRPGGQFVQTMNLDGTMREFYTLMATVLSEAGLPGAVDAMHAHIRAKRRPLSEMVSLLDRHGFRVEKLAESGFAYSFLDGTTMLEHHFIRLAFLGPWKALVPPDRQPELFATLESRLNAQARTDGSLRLSVPLAVIDGRKRER